MKPRLNVITLGVRDLQASFDFYTQSLGWSPRLHIPEEAMFFQVGHGLLLALFRSDHLAAEAGTARVGDSGPHFTLGHNVDSPEEVDQVLSSVATAGGAIIALGSAMSWGGYSGYFADPDGFRWEVCHNPGLTEDPDGHVTIVDLTAGMS